MQTQQNRQSAPYNQDVMAGRPPSKAAPPFGQRLAGARRSRGWSQTKLAEKLQTTQKVIDYYERRAVNPSLAFIQRAAEVLEVSAAELVGGEPAPGRSRPGPAPQLARRLEQIRQLPRKQQEFVIRLLDTVIEQAGRT
jgi:transcriptional regulator with XRE-family HTH domain